MTVLVDWEIREAISKGDFEIDPYDPESINSNSINVTLGNYFNAFTDDNLEDPINPKFKDSYSMEPFEIKDNGRIFLRPQEFILASLKERTKFGSSLCGQLQGRSSLARLGLLVHTTAGWADSNWNGVYTLELYNCNKKSIILTPGMGIAQIILFRNSPVELGYDKRVTSKYMNQEKATPSMYFKD